MLLISFQVPWSGRQRTRAELGKLIRKAPLPWMDKELIDTALVDLAEAVRLSKGSIRLDHLRTREPIFSTSAGMHLAR